MRLTDADAFIEKLAHVPMVQEAIKKAMDTMPTIDAVPIKHGHWKIKYLDDIKVNRRYAHIICSECKADVAHDWEGKSLLKTTLNYNYCPNCGARMDEERIDYE